MQKLLGFLTFILYLSTSVPIHANPIQEPQGIIDNILQAPGLNPVVSISAETGRIYLFSICMEILSDLNHGFTMDEVTQRIIDRFFSKDNGLQTAFSLGILATFVQGAQKGVSKIPGIMTRDFLHASSRQLAVLLVITAMNMMEEYKSQRRAMYDELAHLWSVSQCEKTNQFWDVKNNKQTKARIALSEEEINKLGLTTKDIKAIEGMGAQKIYSSDSKTTQTVSVSTIKNGKSLSVPVTEASMDDKEMLESGSQSLQFANACKEAQQKRRIILAKLSQDKNLTGRMIRLLNSDLVKKMWQSYGLSLILSFVTNIGLAKLGLMATLEVSISTMGFTGANLLASGTVIGVAFVIGTVIFFAATQVVDHNFRLKPIAEELQKISEIKSKIPELRPAIFSNMQDQESIKAFTTEKNLLNDHPELALFFETGLFDENLKSALLPIPKDPKDLSKGYLLNSNPHLIQCMGDQLDDEKEKIENLAKDLSLSYYSMLLAPDLDSNEFQDKKDKLKNPYLISIVETKVSREERLALREKVLSGLKRSSDRYQAGDYLNERFKNFLEDMSKVTDLSNEMILACEEEIKTSPGVGFDPKAIKLNWVYQSGIERLTNRTEKFAKLAFEYENFHLIELVKGMMEFYSGYASDLDPILYQWYLMGMPVPSLALKESMGKEWTYFVEHLVGWQRDFDLYQDSATQKYIPSESGRKKMVSLIEKNYGKISLERTLFKAWKRSSYRDDFTVLETLGDEYQNQFLHFKPIWINKYQMTKKTRTDTQTNEQVSFFIPSQTKRSAIREYVYQGEAEQYLSKMEENTDKIIENIKDTVRFKGNPPDEGVLKKYVVRPYDNWKIGGKLNAYTAVEDTLSFLDQEETWVFNTLIDNIHQFDPNIVVDVRVQDFRKDIEIGDCEDATAFRNKIDDRLKQITENVPDEINHTLYNPGNPKSVLKKINEVRGRLKCLEGSYDKFDKVLDSINEMTR